MQRQAKRRDRGLSNLQLHTITYNKTCTRDTDNVQPLQLGTYLYTEIFTNLLTTLIIQANFSRCTTNINKYKYNRTYTNVSIQFLQIHIQADN